MAFYTEDPRTIPRELSGFARTALELQPQNRFLLEQWFPNVTVNSVRWSAEQGVDQDYTPSAKRRAWNAPAAVSGRPGTRRIAGEMSPLSEQKTLIEQEALVIREGRLPDGVVDLIFDDTAHLILSARNAMELDRADLLEYGKFDYDEDIELDADFRRKAARSTTVVTAWTDAAAPMIADERTFTKQARDEEGVAFGAGLATPETIDLMRVSNDYRNASRDIRVPDELSLAEINEIRSRRELPPLIEYEANVAGRDGVVGRVLPTNKILYVPGSGSAGATQWGRPLIADEANVEIEADTGGPVVIFDRNEIVPVAYKTIMDAITMATLARPNETGALQIAA